MFTSHSFSNNVLIDFSLTVKAATLIFISGRGSAIISSAKQGKSGSIYNSVKELIIFLGRTNIHVRAFHENPSYIHTELTFINP